MGYIVIVILYWAIALAVLVPTWRAFARIKNERNRLLWRSFAVAISITPVPIANMGYFPAPLGLASILNQALSGRELYMPQVEYTAVLIGAAWIGFFLTALAGIGTYRFLMRTMYGR